MRRLWLLVILTVWPQMPCRPTTRLDLLRQEAAWYVELAALLVMLLVKWAELLKWLN